MMLSENVSYLEIEVRKKPEADEDFLPPLSDEIEAIGERCANLQILTLSSVAEKTDESRDRDDRNDRNDEHVHKISNLKIIESIRDLGINFAKLKILVLRDAKNHRFVRTQFFGVYRGIVSGLQRNQ